MKLIDWLKKEGLTYEEYASRIQVKSPRSVQRYATGEQVPGRDIMARIVKTTNGEVTPNDFYEMVPARRAGSG